LTPVYGMHSPLSP